MTTAQPDPTDPTMWDDRYMTRLSIIHMAKSGQIPNYVFERMGFVGSLTEDTEPEYNISEGLETRDEHGRFIDGVVIGFKSLAFEWLNTDAGITAMTYLRRLIEKPIYPAEVEG
jgi:hypothetical protein